MKSIDWLSQIEKKKKRKKNCDRDLDPTGVIQAQNEVFHHFWDRKLGQTGQIGPEIGFFAIFSSLVH